MKKILALLFAVVLAVSFGFAFASLVKADEEADGNNTSQEEENDDEDKNDDEDDNDELENKRENLKQERERVRESLKQETERTREQFKNQRELLIANLQQEKETWKTERQAALAKLKLEKQNMIESFKEKFTAERCARIQERVQERTKKFDEKEGKHAKVYTNLANRINKFISRFDAAGLDTAAIKLHVTELQIKTDKFKADYAAYIAKLKESRTLTCGHSEGEFKGTLVEAKALLKTVHADAADIRKYVRATILADIKALKAQMPKEEDDDDQDKKEDEDKDDDENATTTTTTGTNTTGTTTTTTSTSSN